MSRRRFSYSVIVMRVCKPCAAVREPRNSAGELRPEPLDVIAAELIDSNEDDQSRTGRGGAGRLGRVVRGGAGGKQGHRRKGAEFFVH